ncbi:MAG: PKD domain-containing protein [Vicinamibacteria bacterium]|nr:PKD domain-containing protein [Vicinamibacteria bacterium]
MSREANARARMLEAIKSDESLSLSSAEFPPNVIQLFEEVRQEAGYTPASRATDDSRSTTTVVPSKKKGGSKLPIILIGAAAVGGGALLLMPKNAAPVAGSATATPGTALMAATEVSFASVGASDKDGDTLTYTWDFGDDTAGSGLNVKHVYAVAGNYAAKVTVSDGKKSASTTAPPVTVKNVNGTWRTKIVDSVITFILSQNGEFVNCRPGPIWDPVKAAPAGIAHPEAPPFGP